jgi:hypothetical protein
MSYLEGYGAGEERKLKWVKYGVLGAIALILLATVLYFKFRDYSEHRKAEQFFERLRARDYNGAYALWGCTEQTPCRDYSRAKFMEDWGPSGVYANSANAEIVRTYSCDTGVIEVVKLPDQNLNLWVDRNTDALSFAPWQLKPIPDDTRSKVAAWMWQITRNCQPLIGP